MKKLTKRAGINFCRKKQKQEITSRVFFSLRQVCVGGENGGKN
jgi:hypothetical protein